MERPPAPQPLQRPPRTDLAVSLADLDASLLQALTAVTETLRMRVDQSQSLEEIHLRMTEAQLLQAMGGTHRSIRRLLDSEERDLALDALPLTRVQLERCFLAVLLCDEPTRWFKRYRKNAWKAFAEKFFRERVSVGHLPGYGEHFASDGPGVRMLREFAREMGVWEDELQTLRIAVTNDEPDPRFPPRHIADMPTPAKALPLLTDPALRALAETLYPHYASLSHFSHGGLVGAMQAAVLRSDSASADHEAFFRQNVLEATLPADYVAQMTAATLFALPLDDAPALAHSLRTTLHDAWTPYHSDGSLIGIGVWDRWGKAILGE